MGYTDASFASTDLSTMKSQNGYTFLYNYGPISSSSKRQDVVALSSTEAEFYGLVTTAREAIWLQQLTGELQKVVHVKGRKQIQLYTDNQGALALAYNPEIHQRTKHIAIKWHWIRQITGGYSTDNQGDDECQGDHQNSSKRVEISGPKNEKPAQVKVHYISTDLIVSDGLTKPLARIKHQRFVQLLNLESYNHGI